ncbi:MAG: hypothetical protein U0R68_10790 [Candidatus Nanopelagicales bacterium]
MKMIFRLVSAAAAALVVVSAAPAASATGGIPDAGRAASAARSAASPAYAYPAPAPGGVLDASNVGGGFVRPLGALGRSTTNAIVWSRRAFPSGLPAGRGVLVVTADGDALAGWLAGSLPGWAVLPVPMCGKGSATALRSEVRRLRPARVIAVGRGRALPCAASVSAVASWAGAKVSTAKAADAPQLSVTLSRLRWGTARTATVLPEALAAAAVTIGAAHRGPVWLWPARPSTTAGLAAIRALRLEAGRTRPPAVLAAGPVSLLPGIQMRALATYAHGTVSWLAGATTIYSTSVAAAARFFPTRAPAVFLVPLRSLATVGPVDEVTDGPVIIEPGCGVPLASARSLVVRLKPVRVYITAQWPCDALVRTTLLTAGPPATIAVSVTPDGRTGNGASIAPSVSADGRYVSFSSLANNLVPGLPISDSNQVYRRDTWTATTQLVSATPKGAPGNGSSFSNRISADGRYVLFQSGASDILPGDKNGSQEDLFIRDMVTGVVRLVSHTALGGFPNAGSVPESMSSDGSVVLFSTNATNLGATDVPGMYIWDSRAATEVSGISLGEPLTAGSALTAAGPLSPDGRYLGLGVTTPSGPVGLVQDRVTLQTRSLLTDSSGRDLSDGSGALLALGPAGAWAYVQTDSPTLFPGLASNAYGYGITDLKSPVTTFTSIPLWTGTFAWTTDVDDQHRIFGAVFPAQPSSPTTSQVVVLDAATGRQSLLSADASGRPSTGFCNDVGVAATGRYVSFMCSGSNLYARDGNVDGYDIFVRHL